MKILSSSSTSDLNLRVVLLQGKESKRFVVLVMFIIIIGSYMQISNCTSKGMSKG